MFYVIVAFHVMVCVGLIIVVLMQAGKGAGLAGVFGSSGTQQMFGGRGAASFLAKLTSGLAIVFMLTSITLFVLSAQQGTPSAVDETKTSEQAPSGNEKAPMPSTPVDSSN
jgi:preprotein translocase subunit SecG